jgi:hypothetical protein
MNPSPLHGTVVPSADPRYPYALQSGAEVYPVEPLAKSRTPKMGASISMTGIIAFQPDDVDYLNPIIIQV